MREENGLSTGAIVTLLAMLAIGGALLWGGEGNLKNAVEGAAQEVSTAVSGTEEGEEMGIIDTAISRITGAFEAAKTVAGRAQTAAQDAAGAAQQAAQGVQNTLETLENTLESVQEVTAAVEDLAAAAQGISGSVGADNEGAESLEESKEGEEEVETEEETKEDASS